MSAPITQSLKLTDLRFNAGGANLTIQSLEVSITADEQTTLFLSKAVVELVSPCACTISTGSPSKPQPSA